MSNATAAISRRILDEVWNAENHGAALNLVTEDFSTDDPFVPKTRTGPLLMLDLVHAYKTRVPDLFFSVHRQLIARNEVATFWSAQGHYPGGSLINGRPKRNVHLRGAFVARPTPSGRLRILENYWDCGTFLSSIDASVKEFVELLRPSINQIRIRSLPGRPNAPLVLFPTLSLPGWIGWRRFLRDYPTKSARVTFQLLGNRWALEGHGRVEDYSVRKETVAIEKSFKKSRLSEPFDLVAHSAGGCYALDFALRNPSSIRTLTLIEPSIAWVLRDAGAFDADLREYIARRMRHYRAGITEKQYAQFILETMATNSSADPRGSPYWSDVAAYRENMKFRPAIYKHRDRVARLKDIRFPVLLVGGRHSDRFHQRILEILESLIPRSRLIVMRGGHAPHLGRGMVPFMRHLSRFLAQAPKPARNSRFPS
jgi:pimeloyl-ACP methyl ester carboxylesterase